MKTVIFGCGTIANRIAKGFENVEGNELVGFGSTNTDRAKEYATKFNVKEYGTYDDFLKRDDIDGVYIATYNLNHYELIKKCILNHKHVICEKPMLSSIKENNELFDLAAKNNVLLMEAMKSVFLPINIQVKQMLKDKVIGEVQHIEASFVRGPKIEETHWIYDLKTGGALKDVGSYCAAIMNFMLDRKPTVTKLIKNNTETLADTNAEVLIDYDGITGHLLVSNEFSGDSALRIYGTKGYIVIPEFWKASKGYYVVDNHRKEIETEMKNDFYYEIAHFTYLVNNKILESPIMSRQFSNNILQITNYQ